MASSPAYRRSVEFDPQAFGRRLAAARAWLGLEAKQVARHLELSAEAINRWERGGLRRAPARGHLRLLAEVLEQPEEWLLRGTSPPWRSAASDDRDATSGDRELRDALARQHDEVVSRFDRQDELLRVLMARVDAIRSRLA